MYDCTNKGPHSPVSRQRKYVGGIVLGLRRIGKSSLVLATLSSTGQPFVYIDVRRAYDDISRRVPAERLYEGAPLLPAKAEHKGEGPRGPEEDGG